ncbi:MAG: response regulator, partial [bacterium]|nr:response regulator [Candidatus Kapabacteria bacterium]
TAAAALSENSHDVPFALLYLLDQSGETATLAGAAGLTPNELASPNVIDLTNDTAVWPFRSVIEAGTAIEMHDLPEIFGKLPGGVWPESPQRAIVLPMTKHGQAQLAGFVVVGLSSRLSFTDEYRAFLDLLTGHVATAVANARAYEEERRRADALAELDRAKTNFFSNVSHEFRTPLTLMLGPAEDLLRMHNGSLPREARTQIEVLHRNALRLQRLVTALLDFSRIEAGRIRASYIPSDLAMLTADLASVFRSAIEKARIRLVVDCAPLTEPVFVDREMWEKIVLNLVSNAFKFTRAGEIEVRLREASASTANDDGSGQGVAVLSVRDTGTGIATDQMPHLFERFHRVEGGWARTLEGSGIGLALVKELVTLHGGSLRVESVYGEGSTFIVTIPKGTAHLPGEQISMGGDTISTVDTATSFVNEAMQWLPDEVVAPASLPLEIHSEHSGRHTDARRPRIIWADDNADMRDYVRRLLSEQFDVETHADGEAALAAVRRTLPDLVLADVMMPKLDGFGLLQELRTSDATRTLPVILLSARAGEEARVEGMGAGADDYIVKPFSANELLAHVLAHLELSKQRQATSEALRESEARFRTMADFAPVMIWVTDPSGQCTYLNNKWYEFTGVSSRQGEGFGWLESLHPDDRENANAKFLVSNERREAFRVEYRMRRHDGEDRWVIDSAAPRFGIDGDYLGYIGSVTDITDVKRIETDLRDADRRKDEFLAMLGHELRNPLAAIQLALSIVRMDDTHASTDVVETWAIIDRQADYLLRLVDDLLDMSRVTRGKIRLQTAHVDVRTIVARAVEMGRHFIDERQHTIELAVPDRQLLVEADLVRMTQVLLNLINNAAKYTPQGGHIFVSVEQRSDDVAIHVKDNGIGIPSDMLSSVFDLFTQISRTLERAHGGLGIGLTLVRRLTEMHGGSVTVHSDGVGQGSEFVVVLPLLNAASVPLTLR